MGSSVDDMEFQEAIAEIERINEMELKEVLKEKSDSFIEWDEETPRKDDNIHAHFELEGSKVETAQSIDDAVDKIMESHVISFYCRDCRWGYRITNRREKDGRLIVTLKKCD